MQLTDAQVEMISAHFKDKLNGAGCPLCGNKNWSLASLVGELREHGAFMPGGRSMALIAVVCEKCSGVQFLAARLLGVMPDSPTGATLRAAPKVSP
jgi:hypothetical protein